MRLLECYIENFGRLSSKKYSFKEGLNCIKDDNGSGKTTLAAFIKVMLYGMNDTKKANLDENDRKHYMPWGGGRCGGWLTFSVGRRSYRIERTFAPKAADDSFALYDVSTERISNDYSASLGTELFGIDAEGFERTVFLSERALTPKSDNKSISAKLSDLVGCDGDIGGMDDALENLEKQRKFYYKKGGSGELGQVKSKIAEINRRLDSLTDTERALEQTEKRLREISSEMNSVKEQGGELVKERERAVLRAAEASFEVRYKEMKTALNESIEKRNVLFDFFGGSIPSFSQIDEAAYKLTEAKKLREENKDSPASNEYAELFAYFDGKINAEEMDRVKTKLARLKSISDRTPDPRVERAKRVFSASIPSVEEIEEAFRLKKKSGASPILGIVLAVILCIAGAALGFILTPILYSVSAVGIAMLIAFIVVGAKKKKRSKAKLNEFFESVCEYTPKDSEITRRLEEMRGLLHVTHDLQAEYEKEALSGELQGLAKMFGESGEVISATERIVEKHARLTALAMADRYISDGRAEKAARAKKLGEEAESFTSKFKLTEEDAFGQIRASLTEYNRLNSDIAEKEKELERFRTLHHIGEGDEKQAVASVESIDAKRKALDERLASLNSEYTLTERAYRQYSEELDARDELLMRREELTELLAKQEDNYNVILLTKKYLSAARDNMTARYLGKTKDSFLQYVKTIGGEGDESFVMDTDFGISRLEGASARPSEAYSRGTRDLYNLATRLALVDSLYDGEKPFIILDDPFTALDDKKVKEALRLLREFAKQKQIIYFTCSDSRST